MIIKNARIYTACDSVIEKGYIRIEKDIITEIGSTSELKIENKNEVIINAENSVLLPGFIDAHSHLGMWTEGLGFEGDDGNEDTDPITPHLRAIDSINPLDISFDEAVKNGVTTAFTGVGSGNPIGGSFCAITTFGSKQIDKLIIKENGAIKFALGENPKVTYNSREQTPTTRMAIAALIRETLLKAQRYQEDYNRYMEVLGTEDEIEPPEYDIKSEALLPVLKGEIQAHFHCHRADDIFTAIRIAKEFKLDYVLVHCTEAALIVDELLEEIGTENVRIILGPLISNRSKPELVNASIETAKALAKNKIKFAICTDHPETPIQYLPLTAGVAIRGGLSQEKALEAITINAARAIKLEKQYGSLKVGKKADIVGFFGELSDAFNVVNTPSLVISSGKVVVNKF